MKRDFLYLIAFLVLIFSFVGHYSNSLETMDNLKNSINVLNDSVTYYTNALGQEVATKRALIGEKKVLNTVLLAKKEENKRLTEALKGFKKVKTANLISTETKIEKVFIPYKDTVACVFDQDFSLQNKYFSIAGNSDQYGIKINSLLIPNKQTIVVGKKRTGFFRSEYKIEVTNSNPHIRVTELESYNFKESKKRIAIGVMAGYGISDEFRFKPFIGVGVSYSLIRF